MDLWVPLALRLLREAANDIAANRERKKYCEQFCLIGNTSAKQLLGYTKEWSPWWRDHEVIVRLFLEVSPLYEAYDLPAWNGRAREAIAQVWYEHFERKSALIEPWEGAHNGARSVVKNHLQHWRSSWQG